jgi:xylulokinase
LASADAGYLLGTDIGTSSTKTVLIDAANGRLMAKATAEYRMRAPRAGWAENDPEDWFAAVVDTTRQTVTGSRVNAAQIRGWCIVGQRDPVVLLDARDRPLANSISWIDRRTLDINRELADIFGYERLVDITGARPIAGMSLQNILWTKRFEPSIWADTKSLLFAKDYVIFRLTGVKGTDTSTPSRSVMNDVRRSSWSDVICEKVGVDMSLLPEIRFSPWEVIDEIGTNTAALVGLPPGTPLAAGGGDDQSAALGAGVIDSGDLCGGTGTASGWRCVTERCQPEPAGRADLSPHVVPARFLYETTIASTGSSLRWARDTLGTLATGLPTGGSAYDRLVEEAQTVPPGADGLFYYPYLEGGRTPRFNDDASGVFFGLNSGHTRAHLVRAILEGVAFQYPPSLELVKDWGMGSGRFSLVDGESKSSFWNQMKADVTGREIAVPTVIQSAAVGAAILSSLAGQVFPEVHQAVDALIHFDRIYPPDMVRHAQYEEIRNRYECVYGFLDQAFHCGTRSRQPD